MNTIIKLIETINALCFIIQTEGESDYWWWEVPRYDWEAYFKNEYPNGDAPRTKKNIERFINDFDYGFDCGCSCGGFDSISEAMEDYSREA